MKNKYLRLFFIFSLISLNIGCDQSTKFITKKELKNRGTIEVVGDFFILKYAENNGGFMSRFSDFSKNSRFLILVVIPIIFLSLMIFYIIWNQHLSVLYLIALCTVVGGGASNILDRLFNNENVIDFMNFGINGIRTGILNFADLSIVIGSVMMVVLSFKRGNDGQFMLQEND